MSKQPSSILDVIQTITAHVPEAPAGNGVDTVKLGDTSQAVKGVVTTFMATMKVLEQAVAVGANLIITHEPTFYNPNDETSWLEGNAVYVSKKKYIEENGLVIWRFHDGCHRMKPDGILSGMMDKLGWKFDFNSTRETVFSVEPQTARALAARCKERLEVAMVRVAGDPEAICSRAGFLVGAWGGRAQIRLFMESDIDVLLCGESPEWETCEYIRDANVLNQKKALIILGHANSEEAGMEWLGKWMRSFIPAGVAITHLPANDPFSYI